jgi:adenine-specific DNA-methyltransferase
MTDLSDLDTWRREMGLLPVPLVGEGQAENSYVLFNGTRGNFCLYLDGRSPDAASRSQAWSANVGHAVTLAGDQVLIQRWDRPEVYHPMACAELRSFPDRFHRRLEEDAPAGELSIIALSLGAFRSLRNALGPSWSGGQALKGFLYLLAAILEGAGRRQVALASWRLDAESEEVARALSETDWSGLVALLCGVSSFKSLQPDLSLTLRHAAGVLFQEAHYSAIFGPVYQRSLPGFPPPPVEPGTETSSVGVHFTPVAVVRTLVEEALSALGRLPQNLCVFDPACGSAEFLRETLRQIKLHAGFSGKIRLVGFDVSPTACALAEFVLGWEARGIEEQVDIEIRCCDALRDGADWPQSVDLLLMNPPFVSWRDLTPEQGEAVRRILGPLSKLRPDLSTAFLWKAAQSLGEHAVLATVIPSSFLDGVGFRSLRAELGAMLSTRLVARLGSHDIFPSARVDASLYVGGRGIAGVPPLAVWADHRISSTSAALRALRRLRTLDPRAVATLSPEGDGFSLYETEEIGRGEESWAPRPYREWKLAHSLRGLPPVGDRFSVQQGTITGLNRVFLLGKSEWSLLPEAERPYFRPCVLNDSILGGRLSDDWYVFYPYGAYSLEGETEVRKSVPTFFRERLRPQKAALLERRRIQEDRWWKLSEHRAWQRKQTPKIVSTYFGEAGSFAWDSTGAFVVVQGYGWLPKAPESLGRTVWLAYLALLNSDIFSSLLAAHSNHVGGGQWNLSKRFVEKIPLPDLIPPAGLPADSIRDERAALAQLGATIHRQGLDVLLPEDRDKLSQFSLTAYTLAASRLPGNAQETENHPD